MLLVIKVVQIVGQSVQIVSSLIRMWNAFGLNLIWGFALPDIIYKHCILSDHMSCKTQITGQELQLSFRNLISLAEAELHHVRSGAAKAVGLRPIPVDAADVPCGLVDDEIGLALRQHPDRTLEEAVAGQGLHGDLVEDGKLRDPHRGVVMEIGLSVVVRGVDKSQDLCEV